MDDDPSEQPGSPEPERPRTPERQNPPRRLVALVIAPIAVLTVIANVGNRLYFSLAATQPWLLLAMNPTNLVMATATPRLSAAVFFTTVIVRRLLVDPLYWLLGYWYGDDALRWMKRRSTDLGVIAEKLEQWFPRYGRLLAFLYPHPLVILLAGASGMKLRTFMLYDFLGTVAIAIAVRQFGSAAASEINAYTDFLGDNQLAFGIVSVVLLAYYVWTFRKGDSGGSGFPGDDRPTPDEDARDDDRRDGDEHRDQGH